MLRSEPSLVLLQAMGGEEGELGLDGMNPGVSVEQVLCLLEQRGLRAQKVFIVSNMRLLMSPSSMGLLLLPLGNVPQ